MTQIPDPPEKYKSGSESETFTKRQSFFAIQRSETSPASRTQKAEKVVASVLLGGTLGFPSTSVLSAEFYVIACSRIVSIKQLE
jgi:hypothetical protein